MACAADFSASGVYVVSLVSSPGAGKTAFLERSLSSLCALWRVAALVGDLATDNDARDRARGRSSTSDHNGHCLPFRSGMVCAALGDWNLSELDYLFIENVGNLVCPATFDLGEAIRVVLFSVTEGEDKPLKYPTIFHTADVAIITKIDLAAAVDCNLEQWRRNVQAVRPGMKVLEVSARSGQGMNDWLALVESRSVGSDPQSLGSAD